MTTSKLANPVEILPIDPSIQSILSIITSCSVLLSNPPITHLLPLLLKKWKEKQWSEKSKRRANLTNSVISFFSFVVFLYANVYEVVFMPDG